jgi:hypothetical protein
MAPRMGEVTPSPVRSSNRVTHEQGNATWNKETRNSLIVPDLRAGVAAAHDTTCRRQVPNRCGERPPMRFIQQGNLETKMSDYPVSDLKDGASNKGHAKYLALRLAFPELQEHDVLLGRSPIYYNQPGNQRFLKVLKPKYQSLYKVAHKADKRGIALRMVDEIYELGGRFMACEDEVSGWVEVSNEVAREKAAQTLREDLSKAERQLKRLRYPKRKRGHAAVRHS